MFAVGYMPVNGSPSGSANYSGESIMRIDLVDASEGASGTIQKFGDANMFIDFGTGCGTFTVTSNDGNSALSMNINAYSDQSLAGSGTFSTSDDTYTGYYDNVSLGCSISPYDCGFNIPITRTYDAVDESSGFIGSLTGTDGTGAMGVSMGNNHIIGISLE